MKQLLRDKDELNRQTTQELMRYRRERDEAQSSLEGLKTVHRELTTSTSEEMERYKERVYILERINNNIMDDNVVLHNDIQQLVDICEANKIKYKKIESRKTFNKMMFDMHTES